MSLMPPCVSHFPNCAALSGLAVRRCASTYSELMCQGRLVLMGNAPFSEEKEKHECGGLCGTLGEEKDRGFDQDVSEYIMERKKKIV